MYKLLGPVWFIYLTTVFCPQKQEIQGDTFVFQFFFFFFFFFFFVMKKTKNTENIKFRKEEQFSKNTKMVFIVFPKSVLKKSFKKQETNRPLASHFDIL